MAETLVDVPHQSAQYFLDLHQAKHYEGRFEKIEQIGEGTYGQVFRAKEESTGEIVALKKVRMDQEKEGFPITAIREIKILKQLSHANVVKLKDVVTAKATDYNRGRGSIYMVFEYLQHDLTGLLDAGGAHQKLTEANVKHFMKQLLDALLYCHTNSILHRDIKGSNLLIGGDGSLKLADFGLARQVMTERTIAPAAQHYTNRVITLWYRPPELLLGSQYYGPEIDMWGVGCIFAELLTRSALFPGKDEADQLEKILSVCGCPAPAEWPEMTRLPYASNLKPRQRRLSEALKLRFPDLSSLAIDLLDKLLQMNPKHRPTAAQALDHDYFWNGARAQPPSGLDKLPAAHEYQAKLNREKRAQGSRAGGLGYQDVAQKLHQQAQQRPPQHHAPGPVRPPAPLAEQLAQSHAQQQPRPHGSSFVPGPQHRSGHSGHPHQGGHPGHPGRQHHQQQHDSVPGPRSHHPPQQQQQQHANLTFQQQQQLMMKSRKRPSDSVDQPRGPPATRPLPTQSQPQPQPQLQPQQAVHPYHQH